jgi:hypothetical protein
MRAAAALEHPHLPRVAPSGRVSTLGSVRTFFTWLKAGPAGGRLRRPSSAGSGTADAAWTARPAVLLHGDGHAVAHQHLCAVAAYHPKDDVELETRGIAASGSHLVALRFTGHQTTLRVNGPWGVVSAFSATTSDNPVATALWDGSAGETLFFTFSFTGGIIGFLKSIQMHLLA